jgi:hypothetical protein
VLWQKDKIKENKVYLSFQVLNLEAFAVKWTDIQEIPVLPHAISSGVTFYSLQSGEELWTSPCALSCITDVLSADDESVNLTQSDRANEGFSILRYDVLTGQELQNCSPQSGAGNMIWGRYWFPLLFAYSSKEFIVDDGWMYADTTQVADIAPVPNYEGVIDIYKFPDCSRPPTPVWSTIEVVSKEIDRYYLPTLLYADIAPFTWIGKPYTNFFLFQKDGHLYKVAVPEQSFTYLYHNKTDDSVYLVPKFADIDPPPYQLIPGIDAKVVRVELMDNFIYTLLEDGILQIIDFDSLTTVLKVQTNLQMYTLGNIIFKKLEDVIVLLNATETNQDLIAFQLPSKN